jgi:oligopeptide/dipeptide ABC transporter ATP-binding protein
VREEEAEEYRHMPPGVRPLLLAIACAFLFASGLFFLVAGALAVVAPWMMAPWLAPFGLFSEFPQATGVYAALGGAVTTLLAGALWDLRRWARPVTVGLMGLFLFANILGFPAGVVVSIVDGAILAFFASGWTRTVFPPRGTSPVVQVSNGPVMAVPPGAIDVAQLPPRAMRHLRRRMQIVFQDPFSSMDPRMLVKNIVGEPLRVHRIPRWWCPHCRTSPLMEAKTIQLSRQFADPTAPPGPCEICGGALVWTARPFTGREVRSRTGILLERVGLNPEHLYRFPHEFSGGQRQRIGIARALALNPDFIVLDEPTSALDVSVQAQILNLLKDLQRELGLTYLFISHHLAVVHHICDRVNVMYVGEIVESAKTEELFREPLHPYTRALLSAIPEPDPDRKMQRIVLPGDVPSPANPPAGCRFHPRCPVAFEICGWTPPEVLDALDQEFHERQLQGAREPGLVERVEMGDPRGLALVIVPGRAADVAAFVDRVRTERAESVRAFKAVAQVVADGDTVWIGLHEGRVPILKDARREHEVACHLY